MVRRRKAPSPDDASHRRENHEAPIVPWPILRDAASRLLQRQRQSRCAGMRSMDLSQQNSSRSGSPPRSLISIVAADRFLPSPDPNVHAAPLHPRPPIARQGGAAGLDSRLRQSAAGRRAIRRAGAVRQDRRRALRQAADRAAGLELGLAAAGGLGGVRPVHHRLQRAGRAPCRQAGAPPAPGGADRLFRAHHATAADLPHRHPFRPADEGDAERHRRAVAALARILPRAFCRDPVAGGAAAAGVLHQLAAGGAACSCCAWCSPC